MSDLGGSYRRDFACWGCGAPLPKVYPPDDVHTVADRYYYDTPVDCVPIAYRCEGEGCVRPDNIIYWYSQQAYLVAAQLVQRPSESGWQSGTYNYNLSGSTGATGSSE